MSTPDKASVPGGWADTQQISFTAAAGTQARILSDVSPASGNYLGGQRVYDITISSSDAVANALTLLEGAQKTLYVNMGVATTTATTNATITRTTGSFITEGYLIGDSVMPFGAVASAENGVAGTLTSVSATTLIFNGVPTGWAANTEGAGFRLFRITKRAPVSIPANAGIATSVSAMSANVQVIGQSNDSTRDALGIELGAASVLLCALYQAASALPAQIQVTAKSALR